MIGDEFVEIGVGEHAAHTLPAMADIDISERAGSNMAVERLDRATQLARCLGGRAQAIRRWKLADAEQGFKTSKQHASAGVRGRRS